LRGTEAVIDLILSHWATYVFLAWLPVCILGNLLKQKKPGKPPVAARFPPLPPQRLSKAQSFDDELELANHRR
jgi:hypothetical protein